MDLHLPEAAPNDSERDAIDGVLGPWDDDTVDDRAMRGGREAIGKRHLLLPALHATQARAGWVSPGALAYISARLQVPPAEAYGVASFYAMLALKEQPSVVAYVCDDLACRVNGGERLAAELPDARRSPCLGQCERAPAALVRWSGVAARDVVIPRATVASVVSAASGDAPDTSALPASLPQAGEPGLRLLRRVGVVDPTRLDDYRAQDGWLALRRAIDIGAQAVLRDIKESKVLGRGGAAFPMGVKWESVARAPARPHYVVCNADESEPGTFSNRIVMEQDPFSVVEGMTIAGFATGSELGYLYIRGEYMLAAERMQSAVDQSRARGYLGDDIMGTGVRFDIEVRRGAGAYVCGEETSLFNSIEGRRGEPRNKPPLPVTFGLFGKPTCINNVETLCNAMDVVLGGGPGYARTGTAESSGTKLFCVSGSIARPGLYEMPFGTTLRALIDLAGGLRPGRSLRTVLLGGAAGTFIRPDEIDVPLTFEDTRRIGAALGSGAVLVFDDTVSVMDLLRRIAAFFREESCGQCVPCRVGTVRQEEALQRIATGGPGTGGDVELLDQIARVMRDASICGLGQTAASAVQSAITRLGVLNR